MIKMWIVIVLLIIGLFGYRYRRLLIPILQRFTLTTYRGITITETDDCVLVRYTKNGENYIIGLPRNTSSSSYYLLFGQKGGQLESIHLPSRTVNCATTRQLGYDTIELRTRLGKTITTFQADEVPNYRPPQLVTPPRPTKSQ